MKPAPPVMRMFSMVRGLSGPGGRLQRGSIAVYGRAAGERLPGFDGDRIAPARDRPLHGVDAGFTRRSSDDDFPPGRAVTPLQAILLGIVQGLTEFLPV